MQQRTAREHVDHRVDTGGLTAGGGSRTAADGARVDVRRRDRGTQPQQHQDAQREEDLLAKVRRPERIEEGGDHPVPSFIDSMMDQLVGGRTTHTRHAPISLTSLR